MSRRYLPTALMTLGGALCFATLAVEAGLSAGLRFFMIALGAGLFATGHLVNGSRQPDVIAPPPPSPQNSAPTVGRPAPEPRPGHQAPPTHEPARESQRQGEATPAPSKAPPPPSQKAEARLSELRERLAEAEVGLDRREQALLQAQADIHGLEDQLDGMQRRRATLADELAEARGVISTFAGHAEAAAAEITAAKNRIATLEETLQQARSEAGELKAARAVLERDLAVTREDRAQLEEELSGKLASIESDRESLKGAVEHTRQSHAQLQQRVSDLSHEVEMLRAENETLSEAVSNHRDHIQAVEAGRLASQRAAEDASREKQRAVDQARRATEHTQQLRAELKQREAQLAQLKAAAMGHGEGPAQGDSTADELVETLGALGLPVMLITGDGLVASVSAPLAALLGISQADAVGMDEWTFATQILMHKAKAPAALRAQQVRLLDGAEPGQLDTIALDSGAATGRWIFPLGGGPEGGRLEIFTPVLGGESQGPSHGLPLDLTDRLEGVEEALAALLNDDTPRPSPNTTLKALGRQLAELGALLPQGEDGAEARARVSTMRALITSLLGGALLTEDLGDDTAARVKAALPPLQRALGALRGHRR